MSQKNMAKRIGVSPSYYYKVESGYQNPSYEFLAILRISQREDYPRNRFELGYESGRFEVEVKNLFLSGGLTTHEEKFLKKCEYIAMFEVNEKEV